MKGQTSGRGVCVESMWWGTPAAPPAGKHKRHVTGAYESWVSQRLGENFCPAVPGGASAEERMEGDVARFPLLVPCWHTVLEVASEAEVFQFSLFLLLSSHLCVLPGFWWFVYRLQTCELWVVPRFPRSVVNEVWGRACERGGGQCAAAEGAWARRAGIGNCLCSSGLSFMIRLMIVGIRPKNGTIPGIFFSWRILVMWWGEGTGWTSDPPGAVNAASWGPEAPVTLLPARVLGHLHP